MLPSKPRAYPNLSGFSSKCLLGLGLITIACWETPYEHQYSPLATGISVTGNDPAKYQTPMVAGKLTKLKIRVTNQNDFGVDIPVYVQKNGVNTSATITINAGIMNHTYLWSGNVIIAENDLLNMHYDLSGASGWETATATITLEYEVAQ